MFLPALFAGGGINGGIVMGSSSSQGDYITDSGWNRNRSIYPSDVVATLYSALGQDWTMRIEDTPSQRVFEAVETTQIGPAYPLTELFS